MPKSEAAISGRLRLGMEQPEPTQEQVQVAESDETRELRALPAAIRQAGRLTWAALLSTAAEVISK
jgi:hypothetical protein